ncbi:MAG: class I SAM-dependent methyltransferase [Gammaproteobacteria bacterium]|nr:class I SAM-dependent methyltransferase [Gammaproteobacteria bacterium]
MNKKYVYDSTDKEAARLKILNEIYNKNTLYHLEKLMRPTSQILEIGPGVGLIGFELAKKLNAEGHYTCLDQDAQHIVRIKDRFSQSSHNKVSILQGSVIEINSIAELQNKKFDLIYCRWVIAHLPTEQIPQILESLYQRLNVGGYLVCEEGDVSTVQVLNSDHSNPSCLAFDKWYQFSFSLEKVFNLDLRMGAKIAALLAKISQAPPSVSSFQPRLTTLREKMMFSYAIASTQLAKNYIQSKDPSITEIIGDMDTLELDLVKMAKDQTIQIDYISNTFTSIRKS